MLSRRRFLQASSLLSLSPVLPKILENTARAAVAEGDERVLVVVQLDGGNDGLNTVVPFADDAYAKARSKLRLETDKLHKLHDQLALHPSMKGAKQLFDDGRLCIAQGVGYPNPDRSHFRSMRIWQTGSFDDDRHDSYGWLGSALDEVNRDRGDSSAAAVYVGDEQTPVALWARRSEATALARIEDMKLELGPLLTRPTDAAGKDASLEQFVSRQVLTAYAGAETFERRHSLLQSAATKYPDTTLGSRLGLISQLIQSGARARVYYTLQSGYDTHSSQLYTHARLLREFSEGIKAFLDDLKAAKLDDRVVLLAFSEFGRRVNENDSQGTDHGTAGPVFLAGSKVNAGLLGNAPDLVNLADGDLVMQMDFRQIYASLLEDWLGVSQLKVLGMTFAKTRVLAT